MRRIPLHTISPLFVGSACTTHNIKMKFAIAALLAGSAAAFAPSQSGKTTTALQVSELGTLKSNKQSLR